MRPPTATWTVNCDDCSYVYAAESITIVAVAWNKHREHCHHGVGGAA